MRRLTRSVVGGGLRLAGVGAIIGVAGSLLLLRWLGYFLFADEYESRVPGLIAGILIGLFAKKVNNLAYGVMFGVAMGALFALPIALMPNGPNGEVYFWEILIPGSLVGLIVGFLTQRYGMPALAKR